MISIIIPVYNMADKLDKCLNSIVQQTYQDFEIIIVNDGSTDNLSKILTKYNRIFNDKLTLINQDNKGSNPARNTGFNASSGEFLLFCDADIIMNNDLLSEMLKVLTEDYQAAFAYSSFKLGIKKFILWPFNAEKLKQMPYIHTCSLIRREKFPGFDENIKRLQDWDLWLTMLEKDDYGIWINKILFQITPGGYISNWLPSFFYKFFPFLPKVKKYHEAVKTIKIKHNLI